MTVATLTAAARAAPRAPRDRTLLLMLPAGAMLVVMFLAPLVLFFVRTFTEFDGTAAEFIDQARDLLLSQAYLTALGTTNWISLIVTATVRRSGRLVGIVDVDVTNEARQLLAIGRATYATAE